MAVAKKTTKPVTQTVKVEETVVQPAEVKKPKQYTQHEPILCRSVNAGWLGVSGKSGMYYIFSNYGDQAEIEYGDLFALKNEHSPYLYDPLFVIEDEELLENPRWKDLADFYTDKVYGMDDINEVLNKSKSVFKKTLQSLPKGLLKALTIEVAKRIEDGSFDSLSKIRDIDEVCNTDFAKMINIE
jgi:hypothetical protein